MDDLEDPNRPPLEDATLRAARERERLEGNDGKEIQRRRVPEWLIQVVTIAASLLLIWVWMA